MSSNGLWRHADFLKLWAGQTISVFGSAITGLALPLTAAVTLGATPAQMGILGAAGSAPFLLVGLFAGVWADRVRRRPILISADLMRALLLGLIPLVAWLGLLRIEFLYVIEFLVGVMTVFFDVSYQSFLPALVSREHLVEGNSKLEISTSSAQIVGPGLAGILIQLLTAPVAILLDAASFLVSALALGSIRAQEPAPAPSAQRPNIWREIGEGLNAVVKSPLLRPIVCCTATTNLCTGIWGAVFVLYMTRDLGLQPAALGLIGSFGAPGALLGALVAARVAQRIGVGPAIVGSAFVGGLGGLLLPLAVVMPSGAALTLFGGQISIGWAALPLIAAQFIIGLSFVVYNINQVSLRQSITPDRLLGRLNASVRFIVWGTIPIGSLIGGALGTLVGLHNTIIISAVGMLFAFLWVFFSPVRPLREQPSMSDVQHAPAALTPATAE